MNRRNFLRMVITGLGTSAINHLFSRTRVLRANQLDPLVPTILMGKYNFDVLDFYRVYSANIGGQTTQKLVANSFAEDARERVRAELAKLGYTDYTQSVNYRMSHSNGTLETYFVRHENGVDACAPYFADYQRVKRRPMLEAAAILGLALGTEEYRERHGASDRELEATFMPIRLDTARSPVTGTDVNMRDGRIVGATNKDYSVHTTERGKLTVNFQPGSSPTIGVKAYDNRGGIIFKKAYPFSIIPDEPGN